MNHKEYMILYELLVLVLTRINEIITPIQEEQLLNSNEMCAYMKCSQSTLRRLRNDGTIPCNKIGRTYYYPKSYFTQEFLKSILKVQDDSIQFDDKI